MIYSTKNLYPPTLSLANNNSKCVHDRSLSARDIISLVQHYPSLEGRPEQCFFFDTCGKLVSQKKSQQSNVWKTSIFIQITRILSFCFSEEFLILCNCQNYKSKCLKREKKLSLRMSVYFIVICKHYMLICQKNSFVTF